MSDDGIKSASRGDLFRLIEVDSFELIDQETSEKHILYLSDGTAAEKGHVAYSCPPRLLEELARHILRTVAPTTEDQILAVLNRIEVLLKQREQ